MMKAKGDIPVTDKTTTKYSLRLTARFVVYVESGSNLFRDWPKGAIITDPNEIKFLESRDAPIERDFT
jgi:hypothetical protein